MFHHLAHLISHFCQFTISLSRTGQTVEQRKSQSTQPNYPTRCPSLYKIGMANLWLFGWLVELIMAADPTTDAAQRTTTAPTILSAGVKTNIVPMEVGEVMFCYVQTSSFKFRFPHFGFKS